MDKKDYVWYACYGSNLMSERFKCYIKGGLIPGNKRSETGAENKSLPVESRQYIIDHKLIFAYHAQKWDGSGVAFISPEAGDHTTYGRIYLITWEQFIDVVRQENALPPETDIIIDRLKLQREKSYVLFPDTWYGRILYLGEESGYPVYTFTSVDGIEDSEKVPASGAYYDVIADGLKETYGFSNEKIESYMQAAFR